VSFEDIFVMGPNGDMANDTAMIYYWQDDSILPQYRYITCFWGRRDEDNYKDIGYRSFDYEPEAQYGETVLAGGLQVAGESDRDDSTFWIVEREDCVAARFTYDFDTFKTVYVGPYFGVSRDKSDADDRIYEPLDMSRDNKNHFYILDHLSTGKYVIKGFSHDDTSTTALGSFGDSSDWDLTPARIAGSDFDGSVILLQLSGMDAKISVFTDDEIPG
jgi:hypothetical protein